jgi:hypothetical protein
MVSGRQLDRTEAVFIKLPSGLPQHKTARNSQVTAILWLVHDAGIQRRVRQTRANSFLLDWKQVIINSSQALGSHWEVSAPSEFQSPHRPPHLQ